MAHHIHLHLHRSRHVLHEHDHDDDHQHSYTKSGYPDDLDEWHPERRFLYDGERLHQLLKLSVDRARRKREAEWTSETS